MQKIKIVTDSSCDIPRHYAEELNIAVCPLSVTIDGTTYREWYDITSEQFLNMLPNTSDFPKTALAGPELFLNEYKKAEEEGYEEIIAITISSKASGTFQSATIAKEMYEDEGGKCPVHLIDSQGLSYAFGLQTVEAAKAARNGKSIEEISEKLLYIRRHVQAFFAVDTLEYLKRGGRISSSKAAIGSLLDLKPILTMSEGSVEQLETIRGSKKIIPRLVQLASEASGDKAPDKLYVGYGTDMEGFSKLKAKLSEKFEGVEQEDFQVGVVVGAHAGPGFYAVFVINPEFENEWAK